MQYMFLIYSDESQAPEPPQTPEGQAEWMKPWHDYNAAMREAGVEFQGNALQNTPTATTVRAHGKEPVVTDGPFAETKEQLGGYYLVELPDLDQALAWAGKCPAAKYGSVEVRPILDVPV